MTQDSAFTVDNAAWYRGGAKLSVLIPFKGDDPIPLLAALSHEAAACAEIVILDDGSEDQNLSFEVEAAVGLLPLPARFIRLARNEGRSKGRNRLVSHARAGHFLFLDSDMLPDDPHFLGRWLELIARDNTPVAFGGFSLKQVPPRRDQAEAGPDAAATAE